MKDVTERLRLTANYLNQKSNEVLDDLVGTTPGLSLAPHPDVKSQHGKPSFQQELDALLTKDCEGAASGGDLRRIAELTELLEGDQQAQPWWEKAASAGDSVAIMMLSDV